MPALFLIRNATAVFISILFQVIQALGPVIFVILFEYLDTCPGISCQVAFSAQHISRHYTFENMHMKIKRNNTGTTRAEFIHTQKFGYPVLSPPVVSRSTQAFLSATHQTSQPHADGPQHLPDCNCLFSSSTL